MIWKLHVEFPEPISTLLIKIFIEYELHDVPDIQVNGFFLLEVVGAVVGEEVLLAVGVRDRTIIGVGEIEGVGVPLSL